MLCWLPFGLRWAGALLKSRRDLLLENLALRHQLLILSRNAPRPRWTPWDRGLWAWLSRAWHRWRTALRLVQPETLTRSHRQGFRLFWKWRSRRGKAGRKSLAPDTISLIRNMSRANPLWGAPRLHGELLKPSIAVAQRAFTKYMVRRPQRSASQNWTSFPRNHLGQMVSVDSFAVPTLRFQVLYAFLVLSHTHRQVLHFNITTVPSARWTAQQLRAAFPFACPPKHLLCARDGCGWQKLCSLGKALIFKGLRCA